MALFWEMLQTTNIENACIANDKATEKNFTLFLIMHYYMKGYLIEDVIASRLDLHEQMLQKWVKYFLKKSLVLLDAVVVCPDHFDTDCIALLDCVDFGVNEPRHATLHKDKRCFDCKGGKASLFYKIALDLWHNHMIWFNGPFPPNDGNDATAHKTKGLMERIPDNKWLIADKIFVRCNHISGHNSLNTNEVREFKAHARACQESFNVRSKTFGCLRQCFCHGVAKHKVFARAVCLVAILQTENGSPFFWFNLTLNLLKR